MRWIAVAVAVALVCCSCVTVDGLALDMRISETTADMHHQSDVVMVEEPVVGCGDKGDDIILSTGLPDAPFLPPTTLEEETYSGHTRFLSRANGNGVELDIRMDKGESTLSADFREPTELSLDISDWNEPESFRPMWLDDDGRGSALEVEPNHYVELGDDWDGEWEPGTWRDDEQFKPNNPGTYEVYHNGITVEDWNYVDIEVTLP